MARKTNAQLTKELEVAEIKIQGLERDLGAALSRAERLGEDRVYLMGEQERLNRTIRDLSGQVQAMENANRTVTELVDVTRTSLEITGGQSQQQGETIAVLHNVIDRIMDWHETDRLERAVNKLGETLEARAKSEVEPEAAQA